MTRSVRRRRLVITTILFSLFYLVFKLLSRSQSSTVCSKANARWEGPHSIIAPPMEKPFMITLQDKTTQRQHVKLDVTYNLGRSENQVFQVFTNISTTPGFHQQDILVTYTNNAYTLFVTDAMIEFDKPQCVKININLMIPTNKPLKLVSIISPTGNVTVLESAWGSVPKMEFYLGKGNFIAEKGQRLHVNEMTVQIQRGLILGDLLISQGMNLHTESGYINCNLGFSPHDKTANFYAFAASGNLDFTISEKMFRNMRAIFQTEKGNVNLVYPEPYEGAISLKSLTGKVGYEGEIEMKRLSLDGELPAYIEAKRGPREQVAGVTAVVRKGDVFAKFLGKAPVVQTPVEVKAGPV